MPMPEMRNPCLTGGGNIKPNKDREFRVILDGIEEDQTMTSSLHIGSIEGAVIDVRMSSHTMVDDDDSVDGMTFYDTLYSHAKDGDYMMSIGSTLLVIFQPWKLSVKTVTLIHLNPILTQRRIGSMPTKTTLMITWHLLLQALLRA